MNKVTQKYLSKQSKDKLDLDIPETSLHDHLNHGQNVEGFPMVADKLFYDLARMPPLKLIHSLVEENRNQDNQEKTHLFSQKKILLGWVFYLDYN